MPIDPIRVIECLRNSALYALLSLLPFLILNLLLFLFLNRSRGATEDGASITTSPVHMFTEPVELSHDGHRGAILELEGAILSVERFDVHFGVRVGSGDYVTEEVSEKVTEGLCIGAELLLGRISVFVQLVSIAEGKDGFACATRVDEVVDIKERRLDSL